MAYFTASRESVTRIFSYITPLLLLCFIIACQGGKNNASAGSDDDIAPPADALFKKVASSESNLHFKTQFQEDFFNNIVRNPNFYNGGGIGVIDINKDGLQDLFFSSTTGECKLFLNEGGFKFKDITASAGVAAPEGFKTGVSIADVNGDEWPDIYMCRAGLKEGDQRRNLLFINNKDNTFTESAKAYGVDDPAPSNHANFFDYDLDGDLDLYVINFPTDFGLAHRMDLEQLPDGRVVRNTKPHTEFDSDRFYRNNGNGTFTEVSRQAGIYNRAFGLSSIVQDWNGDHYPDILIANDYIEPDFMYINNRNGTFTDQATRSFRHMSNHTMGTDAVDINGDGYQDFLGLDMLSEDYQRQKELSTVMKVDRYKTLNSYGYYPQMMRNVLQLNNGPSDGGLPTFSDIGCIAGIYQTDWSWSVLGQDFDQDGWPDLFITNGYPRDVTDLDYVQFTDDSINKLYGGIGPQHFKTIYDYLNLIPSHPQRNYMYRNRGDLTFENKTIDWGFTEKTFSNGAAYADLDNDGDLDLIVSNIEQEASLYRNTAADQKKGNWLELHFEGTPGKTIFNTVARITAGGRSWQQELTPIRGFYSSNEPMLYFGLGSNTVIDKIEVLFPPGNKMVTLVNQPANQRLTVKLADAKPGTLPLLTKPDQAFFSEGKAQGISYTHKEDDYEDFDHERLLPWRMSNPGPYIAVGDVNGDKLEDFYVGGATNAAGSLFLQGASGQFSRTSQATWDADKAYEDTGTALFDADGDGDLDLFVASGGCSAKGGSPAYQPRLYLNDGKGTFTRAADALPQIFDSGSSVTPYDYDQDGDLDIFLGGWCTPGSYPMPPTSHILRNDKGKFSDVASQVAPAFAYCGMVRDVAFADLDGDKRDEMVIAGEWMPITVYKYTGGKYEDATANFGLDKTDGFWRSLAFADFDGDGDLDFMAGNLGMNTRMTASEQSPLVMYAKDFDSNGSIDPLMGYTKDGVEYPLALREVLLKQLPALKKKYVRNKPYAYARMEDLYSKDVLNSAKTFRANVLQSAYFENQNGKFVWKALPNLVQAAPVNAFVLRDLNSDGKPDIVLAGNDYGQQIETSPIDSGNGVVLINKGGGNFQPMYPCQSGLWANLDARSMKTLQTGQGKTLLLVGNNNGPMQVFEMKGGGTLY
ncbi:MAG: VCBS repeat-containing protein [Lewinellaceae bacterium]|nr:VCBS repeat-containing protein [Lewinellaceae bacterium]